MAAEVQRFFNDLAGSTTFWVIGGVALLAVVALVRGGR